MSRTFLWVLSISSWYRVSSTAFSTSTAISCLPSLLSRSSCVGEAQENHIKTPPPRRTRFAARASTKARSLFVVGRREHGSSANKRTRKFGKSRSSRSKSVFFLKNKFGIQRKIFTRLFLSLTLHQQPMLECFVIRRESDEKQKLTRGGHACIFTEDKWRTILKYRFKVTQLSRIKQRYNVLVSDFTQPLPWCPNASCSTI